MWSQGCRWLLLLCLLALLLLLCYCLTPGESVLHANKDTSDPSLDQYPAWKTLQSFFFPSTCIPKENQASKTCDVQQTLNQSECMRYKCCYSPFGTDDFNCLTPFKDTPTQMFRMFGIGMISMIVLGFLPVCCCSFFRSSKWANSLRRKGNVILKVWKKKQGKEKWILDKFLKDDDDGGGSGKKQESEALISP